MTTATNNIEQAVESYFAMWNETDPERRARCIAEAWETDCKYVDPLLEAAGYSALDQMVAGVHAQFPGHRFALTSGLDQHHDRVRFAWELRAPDGSLTVEGIDLGEVGPEGRLRSITGFFGPVAAAA